MFIEDIQLLVSVHIRVVDIFLYIIKDKRVVAIVENSK